jgi:hypothetical protein
MLSARNLPTAPRPRTGRHLEVRISDGADILVADDDANIRR